VLERAWPYPVTKDTPPIHPDIDASLKEKESFYKTSLPLSLAPRAGDVDLCMPFNNPLQTRDLPINHVLEIMDSNTRSKRSNLIGLVGVSGASKTSTAFGVANCRYCMYVEAGTAGSVRYGKPPEFMTEPVKISQANAALLINYHFIARGNSTCVLAELLRNCFFVLEV
jgi:hypothetical protein